MLEFPINQIQAVYTLARKQRQSFPSGSSRERNADRRAENREKNKMDSDTSASSGTWGGEGSRGEQEDAESLEDDEDEGEEPRDGQRQASAADGGKHGQPNCDLVEFRFMMIFPAFFEKR